MAFLDPILDPLLGPLVNQSPFLAIVIITFLVSLFISVVYKFATDQTRMKELKQKQKDFQAKMKELKDQPDRMMEIQKEAMATNLEYMKNSLKPTLITFIPIILLFGWMTAHLAFYPIAPGDLFTVNAFFDEGVQSAELELVDGLAFASTSQVSAQLRPTDDGGLYASWKLKAGEVPGNYQITVKTPDTTQTRDVLITENQEYAPEVAEFSNSEINAVLIDYVKLKPGENFNIPWLSNFGWLGWYIVFSLVFSISIRRIMGLH